MKWLLTTSSATDEKTVARWLREWGCPKQELAPPIPLGEDERVFKVDGPMDLLEKARRCPAVRRINRV
jgi:hypothetical protein